MPDASAPAELIEMGAAKLAEEMHAGRVSAEEVMRAHLDRIAAVNGAVNAVVTLRDPDDCLAEARAADAARRRGEDAGPLAGLPIALKDLAPTKGLRTTMGSPLFADWIPREDGFLAERIKGAGAIVIGKTNTPEFGLGSHTFNEVFGATKNPWNPALTAGGSSGGGSVAAAMRMLPVADGSDMMGSLRNPAGWANIFGFRPTWGRVPNVDSTDLYAHQLSTNGPMGRSVADMALLLDALAGWDDRAPLGIAETPAFLAGLEGAEGSAKGLRIGWMGDWNGRWPMEPGILETCERALKVFEDLGAEVVPLVPDHDFEAIWEGWTTLRSWMMAGKYAADHADPERRARLKPEVIWEVERGLAMSALEVHRAVEKRADWHRTLERVFGGVDLLAAPSAQTWPFPVDWRYPEEIAGRAMDTYHRWMEVMLPASFSGRPAVSVPAGFSGPEARAEGLPIGLQLIGRVRADREVLRAAAAFEAAADWARRTPPEPGAG